MNLCTLAVSIMAVVGTGGSGPQGDSRVRLTVEADRDTTALRAPVQVWITLTNVTGEAVEGAFDLNVERGGAVIEFGPVGGPLTPLAYLDEREVPSADGDPNKTLFRSMRRARSRRLGPGEAMRASVVLGYDPRHRTFLLGSEGEYELRVRGVDPVTYAQLESNTLRIVVRPPGPTDRAVAEAFVPELALLAQGSLSGSDVDDSLLQAAGAFIDRFPAVDHAYLLRAALRRALIGRRGASEVALAARLKEHDRLSPPVPPGGLERAAYDALTPELEMIIHHGEYGSSGEARNLSTQVYLAALEYSKRFEGTTYARLVRFRLKGILQAKERKKRITPEELTVLRGL